MNIKNWFKKTTKTKDNPCRACQCRDCVHNAENGCALGIDQTAFCGKIPERPAHSDEYAALKREFDRMHKENDTEVLAIYELLRSACRAGNMRLLERRVAGGVANYTFYSPLLSGPVYIVERYHRDCIQVKIDSSIWVKFNQNSTVCLRAVKTIENAKRKLFEQEAEKSKKQEAEAAAKRDKQKSDLLNLLADVRTRQGR